MIIWDRSLITGRGLQNGRVGQVKFFPYKKGSGKSFTHAKGVGGGGISSFEVVLTWNTLLSVNHTDGVGDTKCFVPAIFPFCIPLLPFI